MGSPLLPVRRLVEQAAPFRNGGLLLWVALVIAAGMLVAYRIADNVVWLIQNLGEIE